jgi:hypothetical protein
VARAIYHRRGKLASPIRPALKHLTSGDGPQGNRPTGRSPQLDTQIEALSHPMLLQ